MSNYTQTTNFATKDALASGNPLKIVKGTEINTEFANIATAVATKADSASPTFTGTVTIPTVIVSGGTVNGVPYLNASKVLTTGAALAFDGTTLSTSGLTASGTITASGGTANGVGYLNGSKVLTTGSALVFDGANLGVGVTPSAWSIATLQVGFGYAALSTGVTNSRMFANTYYDNSYRYMGTGRATQYEQDGYHAWYTSASGTAGTAITFVQAMTLDASGNLSFNSGYGSAAIAYGCRAWVNFNGTGTVAIRASGNVSSITDNGTGDYTINFTTAMSDANYSVAGSQGGGNNYFMRTYEDATARTASIFRVVMLDVSTNPADPPQANFSIFR